MKNATPIIMSIAVLCGCSGDHKGHSLAQDSVRDHYHWEDMLHMINPNEKSMYVSHYSRLPRPLGNVIYYTIKDDGNPERFTPPGRPKNNCLITYREAESLFQDAIFESTPELLTTEEVETSPFYALFTYKSDEVQIGPNWVIVRNELYMSKRHLVIYEMNEPNCKPLRDQPGPWIKNAKDP